MPSNEPDTITAYPNHSPDEQEQNLPGLGAYDL